MSFFRYIYFEREERDNGHAGGGKKGKGERESQTESAQGTLHRSRCHDPSQ